MLKPKSSRVAFAVLLMVTIVMVVGGSVMASNMGFKLNKAIVKAGTGQVGANWTSIPYFQPYGTIKGFCAAVGFPTTGFSVPGLTEVVPATGVATQYLCNSATANTKPFVAGLGYKISNPNATPTSIIIVGSHDPSLSITVPKATGGTIGNYWFSVPYHTTAVTVANLCTNAGLTATGFSKGSVTLVNAATGGSSQVFCGTSQANTTNLVLGEAVRLIEPVQASVTFIPAHF